MSVPTPTGVLQGVAAFNWDGAVWQPAGRAGPSVATPTGNLQGVAAFTGGPSWAPTGRAGPGVATPTGVLDGVAVYTWSGSQWTPPGGTETVPTPTGGLRGVAAFDWDGTAWQPAAQARSSVPTPYGVLDGVARFGWTGSAWAAVGAPSFQRDFLSGSLGAGAVFTRASPGWYTNATGTLTSATNDTPRFDYDPVTLALKGVLLEETSTNIITQSGDLNNAVWTKFNNIAAAPVTTANQTAAPDGTVTAARIVYPAVSGAGAYSCQYQGFTGTAVQYAVSLWLKGNVGGEQTYFQLTDNVTHYSTPRLTLTTQWQRFSVITPALTATAWYIIIGTDLRDTNQTSTAAQTVFAWGAQVETNYASSYILTTTAAVTRAADALSYPIASVTGFDTTRGTLAHEYILEGVQPTFGAPVQFVGASSGTDYIGVDEATTTGAIPPGYTLSTASVSVGGANRSICFYSQIPVPAGPVHRGAHAWSLTALPSAAHDGVGSASTNQIPASLPTITNLTIAGPMDFQVRMSQWARRTRYWPRQLSPAELISVTS